jgi:hypothetical protein
VDVVGAPPALLVDAELARALRSESWSNRATDSWRQDV